MTNLENYQPTPDEIKKAEEMMTPAQKVMSREKPSLEQPTGKLLEIAREHLDEIHNAIGQIKDDELSQKLRAHAIGLSDVLYILGEKIEG